MEFNSSSNTSAFLHSSAIRTYYQPMIALIYHKFYKLDQNETYLERALNITKNCLKFIPDEDGYVTGKYEDVHIQTDAE